MTTVAILGAGAGGLSSAVELGRAGHEVRLWNRNEATIRPYEARGAVAYRGVLGEGSEKLSTVTSCLDEALAGADVVVVCLPALAGTFRATPERLGSKPIVSITSVWPSHRPTECPCSDG